MRTALVICRTAALALVTNATMEMAGDGCGDAHAHDDNDDDVVVSSSCGHYAWLKMRHTTPSIQFLP